MRSDVFADDYFGRSGLSDRRSARLRSFELRRGSLRHCRACRAVAGAASEGWWSQTGSNRRPHACKARALPAELWPRNQKTNASPAHQAEARVYQTAFAHSAPAQQPPFKKACRAEAAKQRRLVGLGRLELPTSRLSSARSNQLSYKPPTPSPWKRIRARHAYTRRRAPDAIAQTLSPWRVFVREERETKTAKSRLWSSAILKLLAPECF